MHFNLCGLPYDLPGTVKQRMTVCKQNGIMFHTMTQLHLSDSITMVLKKVKVCGFICGLKSEALLTTDMDPVRIGLKCSLPSFLLREQGLFEMS